VTPVSRDEFDALQQEVRDLRESVSDARREVRQALDGVGRLADVLTTHGFALAKLERGVERLVSELLEES
jgi:predicted  nucleic acid-binding Zn-ribbon protein